MQKPQLVQIVEAARNMGAPLDAEGVYQAANFRLRGGIHRLCEAISWLGLRGWAGVMQLPKHPTPEAFADEVVATIRTAMDAAAATDPNGKVSLGDVRRIIIETATKETMT